MPYNESPSMDQKKYVASVCPEYRSRVNALGSSAESEDFISCDGCIHWNNAHCIIFDDVLTGIDQT